MKSIYLLIGILLFSVPMAMGDSNLNEIHLFHQNGETVLKIDATGSFQYGHQIARAKDNKPFRVIIDLFPTIHNLVQKTFTNLPQSMVNSIRTSQYSIKPEKTTRIVMDLEHETVYRIEKKNNFIYVYIPDKKSVDFANWSSGIKPSTQPKARPKVKQSLVMTDQPVEKPIPVLAVKVPTNAVNKTNKTGELKPKPAQIKPETTYYNPQRSSLLEMELTQTAAEPVKKAEPMANKPKKNVPQIEIRPESTFYKPSKSTLIEQELARAELPKTPAKKDPAPVPQVLKESTELAKSDLGPVKGFTMVKKPPVGRQVKTKKPKAPAVSPPPRPALVVTGDTDQPKVSTPKAKTTSPTATKNTTTVAQKPAVEKVKKDNKATSRFRRQPSIPARLRGTIVAEFPKRMVIKYQSSNFRDPFATLATEKRSEANYSFENRLLDIETARLVGVLESSSGKYRALVEDLDGFGFILKSGDRIKKGYVSKIYSDKAMFQLFEYGWSRSHALRLGDNE